MGPTEYLNHVLQGQFFSRQQAADLFGSILEGTWQNEQLAGLLIGLAVREEQTEELLGFLDAMLERSLGLPSQIPGCLDTCGTGGDGLGTFNLSTAAAIVCAAAGVPVAKHGNRSVSSKSGSADVLEAAGISLCKDPARLAQALKECQFAFLFAPNHHPAMARVAPVRKAMKVRTVFNILGPLANPARPDFQLVGVSSEPLLDRYATILGQRGTKALIVHGRNGADEALPGGLVTMVRVNGTVQERCTLDPLDYGFAACELQTLKGGNGRENAVMLWKILEGAGPKELTEAVALNAGLGLHLAGREKTLQESFELARKLLREGSPAKVLRAYRTQVSP